MNGAINPCLYLTLNNSMRKAARSLIIYSMTKVHLIHATKTAVKNVSSTKRNVSTQPVCVLG
ncbi:hypothetical protein Tcan_04174 [Toxocara canis]|uniref:Uncharacterized protein n=1 Tax=Toxocara canis TaxID=6265 RepID=A0A0B2VV22_TOXCA|nr:hypothetical protein Tcan_04174 [Toxocara canis]